MKGRIIRGFALLLILFPVSMLLGEESVKRIPVLPDAPLKLGELAIQESTITDLPSPVANNLPRDMLRIAIIQPDTPAGVVRIKFEKPLNITKALMLLATNAIKVRLSPDIKGAISWKSAEELVFTPQAGALRVGAYVSIALSGNFPLADGTTRLVDHRSGFYISDFSMGSKVSSYGVLAGKPRLVAPLDSGTRKIGKGLLYLLYDQPVDPVEIAKGITITFKNEPLRFSASNPQSIGFDPEKIYDPRHVVAVSIFTLPADGDKVDLRVPTLNDKNERDFETLTFTIFTAFQIDSPDLLSLKAGTAARLQSTWRIGFSSRVDLERFVASVAITPAPLGLSMYQNAYDNQIVINATFEPGKIYSFKLREGFTDLLGNTLKEKFSFAFRSQDLDPVLSLPAGALLLETGSNRLPVKMRNLKNVEIVTWTFPSVRSFVTALSTPQPWEPGLFPDISQSSVVPVQTKDNKINTLHTVDLGITTGSGLKLVQVRATETGTESKGARSRSLLVQTSNVGISSKVASGALFVWVTKLSDATPIANAEVAVHLQSGEHVGTGITAKDGTVRISVKSLATAAGLTEPLLVSASSAKDTSISILKNEELSNAWQFNLPGVVAGSEILPAALFTDRGAYRPGETVEFKAFVRNLPEYSSDDLGWEVKDPRGQTVTRGSVNLDAYRGSNFRIALGESAAVGEYLATINIGSATARCTFRVEEYRVPAFQVSVSGSGSVWKNGAAATVRAHASYLQGGLLDGREIQWRIYRQPEEFGVSTLPGFVFNLERDPSETGNVGSKEGTLNKDSDATFTFTPRNERASGAIRYIAQAAVTDADRQTFAGRYSQVVHSSEQYVGVRPPPKAIFRQGEIIVTPFVITNTAGTPLSGKKMTVYLDTMEYHQTTLMNDEGSARTYNREVLNSKKVGDFISQAGPVDFSVGVQDAGYYRVRATTTDAGGNEASTGFTVTVSGDEAIAWPRFDRERVDLVLDKSLYKAGEIAQVVVQSPFAVATALVTVETGGVDEHFIVPIKGNTPNITIPVKSNYAPNAFVSVVIIRGRTHYVKDATGYETGAPSYKIGYARLVVDPSEQRLAVAVTPSQVSARPGQEVTVAVQVKTAKGKTTDASATIMVVDEAVLGLTGHKTPDPIALAYGFRSLGIRNASNLLDLPHSRRSRFEVLFPGGDSDEAVAMGDQEEILRKMFKSTAYYNPAVPIGADGTGSVTFKLPDNLTTYRVMVVAANKNGFMGAGENSIQTKKPLMIQPVVPRFVYPGDELTIEARVFNGSAKEGQTSVQGEFQGVTVLEQAKPVAQTVKKGGSVSVPYKIRVQSDVAKVVVKFSASMDSFKDALEITIPVRSPGNKVVVVENGLVNGSGSLRMTLPANRIPGTTKSELVLSSTSLSRLKDSVQYLMQYPNGCIEQTTSTAYPLVVLKDLLPEIGVQVDMADLKKFADAGVKRILSFQTTAGGLAYWPGSDKPHAFATAFGLTALIEAKKRGYLVPDASLARMADFLEGSLRTGTISDEMPHGGIADADTRALFVMTLGRLGRPQPAYISTLWQKKDTLTGFGLSFLAVAIKESAGDKALLQPVLAEIKKQATEQKNEAFFEGKSKGGWSLDSPLRTHASSLIAYAGNSVDSGTTGKLLQGLLNRQSGGLWGNTQENVFGIMGVYEATSSESAGRKAGEFAVSVNGVAFNDKDMERNSERVVRLTLPDSVFARSRDEIECKIQAKAGSGLYATIRTEYLKPLDAEYRSARNNGFSYSRSYETLAGEILDLNAIPLGSLIKVRLSLKANQSLHYVAIDDMLPAGLEPLNANLKTTETVDQGKPNDRELHSLSVVSYHEIRDHRVAFFADELSAGNYEFTYLARATTPGVFLTPSGRAEAMYEPEINGTSKMETIRIR